MTDAAQLRADARALGLAAPDAFWALPDAELRGLWNGCGPDAWPQSLRDRLTAVYLDQQPALLIHDYRFDRSDGTDAGWAEADDELEANMVHTVAVRCRGMGRLRAFFVRARALRRVRVAMAALRAFGKPYYLDAARRRDGAEAAP